MKRFQSTASASVYPNEDRNRLIMNNDKGVNNNNNNKKNNNGNNNNKKDASANLMNKDMYHNRPTNASVHGEISNDNEPVPVTNTLLNKPAPSVTNNSRQRQKNGKGRRSENYKSSTSSSSSVASSYTTSSNEYTLTNNDDDDDDDDGDDEDNDDDNTQLTLLNSPSTKNYENEEQSPPTDYNGFHNKTSTDKKKKNNKFYPYTNQTTTNNNDTQHLLNVSGTNSLRTSDYATDCDDNSFQQRSFSSSKHTDLNFHKTEPIFISNPAYINVNPRIYKDSNGGDDEIKDVVNVGPNDKWNNSPDKRNDSESKMKADATRLKENYDSPNDFDRLLVHGDSNIISGSSTPRKKRRFNSATEKPFSHFPNSSSNNKNNDDNNDDNIENNNTIPKETRQIEGGQVLNKEFYKLSPLCRTDNKSSIISTPVPPSPSLSAHVKILKPIHIDPNSLQKSGSSPALHDGSPSPLPLSGILRKSVLTRHHSSSSERGVRITPRHGGNADVTQPLSLDIGLVMDDLDLERTNQKAEYSPGDTPPTVMFTCGAHDSSNTIGTLDTTMGACLLENTEKTGGNDNNENKQKQNTTVTGKQKASVLKESLFLILSSLYGILVVLIGAVIPITDVFVSERVHTNFEAFYVYLYTVSLLFLIYVYAYLLRRNRFRNDFMNRSAIFVRQLSRVWTRSESVEAGRSSGDSRPRSTKRTISLDMSNHHTGTFYLRLGVLGFGMGSMIHSGLHFGSHFSLSEDCSKKLRMVKPLLHMIFAFFQLYFIFMNSKMCIHRYKKLARFGLMHMCATNICVWFRSIVVETVHVIHSHKNRGSVVHNSDHYNIKDLGSNAAHQYDDHTAGHLNSSDPAHHHAAADNHTANCYWSNLMHKAANSAGPYLYPCTIEYSLMCACILYIMWKNVGQRPIRRETSVDVGDQDSDGDDKKRVHRMSVDCTSSSRGLFLGILTIVGSIISIIAFYMLVREPDLKHTAYVLTHVSETSVYLLTLIALVMASYKMKSFNFKVQQEAELEDILIVISYTGLVAFIVFSLMASIIHQASTSSILNIVSNITMLIQATLQTIFMLAGDRMCASHHEQVKRKPGREFVTFMLISNFAMWAINTFETQTPEHNPIQVDVYGIEAWAIFTHISVPLGIYYRFHSTVCMSNIWKNAWKMKKSAESF